MDTSIDLLAIVVAALAGFFFGAFWFARPIWGNAWIAAIGKTPEQVQQEFSPLKLVAAFIVSLILAVVLALLLAWTGSNGWRQGMYLGLTVGLGLVASSSALHFVFEGRPFKLFLINKGYDVIGLTLMGAILGAWR